jgi:hypothetical protein
LPHDWQPTTARDDREQTNKAREAAEALFRPNKHLERAEVPTSSPSALLHVEQSAPRIPRIIAVPSTMPVTDKTVAPPSDPKPKLRGTASKRRIKVPAAQHDRIRALTGYGMTVEQVADLYGVTPREIRQIVEAVTRDHL